MKANTVKTTYELNKDSFSALKGKFGWKNPMQAPRLLKLAISTGIGSIKDKKKVELIADRLAKITGQKPALRGAKKSIASFKVRQNDPVGYQITLR
jgi:large subunit ribosomal protein L5